jgi:20S proteasome alpha/beta subunit
VGPFIEDSMEDAVVTTGIGFKCDDGVVLGTDTQYTATWKTKGEKLFEVTGRQGLRLCIAGAGHVSHIRKAVQIMRAAVTNTSGDLDLDGVIEITEDTLKTIYSKYIDTYPGAEGEKPHLCLLVGMWSSRSGLALLETERTTANPVDDYAVVGSGGSLAQYIVDTVRGYNKSVAQTKLLALYTLKAAKDYDLFSGNETRLKTLHEDGKIETAGAEEIRNAEDYFVDLFSSIHFILTTMVDLPEMTDEEIVSGADLKSVVSRFRERERDRKEKERSKRSSDLSRRSAAFGRGR